LLYLKRRRRKMTKRKRRRKTKRRTCLSHIALGKGVLPSHLACGNPLLHLGGTQAR
jgi:hypothetical protein